VRLAAAWLVLFALWLILVGELTATELVAGAVAALVGVGAGAVVRQRGQAPQIESRGLEGLGRLAVAVPRDFLRLLWTIVCGRRPRGTYRTRTASATDGVAILVASAAPNEIVVASDPAHEQLTVHRLLP
jgi:hypothetical protein